MSDSHQPPPPPGHQGWPHQQPQFAQPAAQPFVGGYHGPDWVPELGVQLASAGTRIGAKALDMVIYVVIQVVVLLATISIAFSTTSFGDEFVSSSSSFSSTTVGDDLALSLVVSAFLLLVDFLYNVVLVAKFGGQPGKLMIGLRVIRADGAPMDFRTAFIRWAPILALSVIAWIPLVGLVAGLGRFGLLVANLVMVLSDPRHRSVYDRVAGTYVITAR